MRSISLFRKRKRMGISDVKKRQQRQHRQQHRTKLLRVMRHVHKDFLILMPCNPLTLAHTVSEILTGDFRPFNL